MALTPSRPGQVSDVRAAIALSCCLFVLVAPLRVVAHGDLHEQIEDVSVLLARDPNNAALLLKRAELYRLHGEWASALKEVERARQSGPALAVVDLLQAKILADAGQLQRAQTALDRFLEREPAHVDGLLTRGQLLTKLGNPAGAADDYARAIAASPHPEPDYYLQRAEALLSTIPPQSQAALACLDVGIRTLGPLVTLQLAAIDVEVTCKNFEAALRRLDVARRISARQETWLVRRGDILVKAGRAAEALQAYSEALHAIESLPPNLRKTDATRQLEARARTAAMKTAPKTLTQ